MARKPNPLGISRTQVMFLTPNKDWVAKEAARRDAQSKSHGGRAVDMSDLVNAAVEFMRDHTKLVDAWSQADRKEKPRSDHHRHRDEVRQA